MTTTIEYPGTRRARAPRRGVNLEMVGWVFMRGSGVLLVVLIFGHLASNLLFGDGVKAIDFGFVGGKWAQPFWQWWDLAMLWLALIHGGNGLRTIVNDYTSPGIVQHTLKAALALAVVVLIVLGTLVIFAFDPCPAASPANLLPSFCTTR